MVAQAYKLFPGAPHSGPILLYLAGGNPRALLYGQFLSKLKVTLASLGEDSAQFAVDSFRRGGASWALQQGLPGEVIRLLGDWQSQSYLRYLSVPLPDRCRTLQVFSYQLPTTLWRSVNEQIIAYYTLLHNVASSLA